MLQLKAKASTEMSFDPVVVCTDDGQNLSIMDCAKKSSYSMGLTLATTAADCEPSCSQVEIATWSTVFSRRIKEGDEQGRSDRHLSFFEQVNLHFVACSSMVEYREDFVSHKGVGVGQFKSIQGMVIDFVLCRATHINATCGPSQGEGNPVEAIIITLDDDWMII
jgi:hypothetical protein